VTVAEAVADAERRLAAVGIATPRIDAERLAEKALGVSRTELYLHPKRSLSDEEWAELDRLLERRSQREPLAYVLGEWGFRRLTLKTDGRALVPRPETEIVVERALAAIDGLAAPRVLDVGVGSCAIALAIADEHRGARVTGVDTSRAALALARENASRRRLDVELRLAGVEAVEEGWDLVVANPPYIPRGALADLQPELWWEPRQALVDAGLHDQIARRARTRALVLEVGEGQAAYVEQTLSSLGYVDITVTRDLAGTERVVEGRR
jgi:release factor glutamine methyltransferase